MNINTIMTINTIINIISCLPKYYNKCTKFFFNKDKDIEMYYYENDEIYQPLINPYYK
jgi:hypothetical protein